MPEDNPIKTVTDNLASFNPTGNLSREEKADAEDKIDQVILTLLGLSVVLSPLIIVPVVTDWYNFPKSAVVLALALAGAVLFAAKSFLTKKVAIGRSVLDLPLILFLGATLVSAVFANNQPLSLSSDPPLIAGAIITFFLIGSTVRKAKQLSLLIKLLVASGAAIAAWSVVQVLYANIQSLLRLSLTLNFPFLNPSFSLTGSLLAQALLITAILPLALGFYLENKKEPLRAISLAALGAGLLATIYTLYNNRPILLDFASAWKIATGTLGESLQSAIFGVGPEHFLEAFTAYKPIDFNSTALWNLRFSVSSDYYLYLLTTLGVVGLAAFIFLITKFVSLLRARLEASHTSPLEKGLLGSITLILILFAFFPAPGVVIFSFFVFLAILMALYRLRDIKPFASFVENFPLFQPGTGLITTLFLAVVLIGSAYFLGRYLLADYYYAQSLRAASQNKGTDTYNLQIKATSTFPWNDTYHLTFSQTNLALADSLAGQSNLSDQQKQTVIALVQQSLREARVTVALEPRRAGDWENLSLIYRNLINFAQGADQWATASEQQAVTLDPTNPRLRLDLGGIYLALQDYQSAGQVFSQAVSLKPDFANAHYNLAQAMKLLNLKDQALQQLQLTASLTCATNANSADCLRVNSEIQALGSTPATPAANVTPTGANAPIATASSENNKLPNAKTQPPPKISSPSGEITP